jgi:hypothetical protein
MIIDVHSHVPPREAPGSAGARINTLSRPDKAVDWTVGPDRYLAAMQAVDRAICFNIAGDPRPGARGVADSRRQGHGTRDAGAEPDGLHRVAAVVASRRRCSRIGPGGHGSDQHVLGRAGRQLARGGPLGVRHQSDASPLLGQGAIAACQDRYPGPPGHCATGRQAGTDALGNPRWGQPRATSSVARSRCAHQLAPASAESGHSLVQ